MRCLYAMPRLPWPLHGGRAINAHQLLSGLVSRGHNVKLILEETPDPEILNQWPLNGEISLVVYGEVLNEIDEFCNGCELERSWLETRCESFWDTHEEMAAILAGVAKEFKADYVEVCGQEVLPWLAEIPSKLPTIWLAADDPCLFSYSLLKNRSGLTDKMRLSIDTLKLAVYERTYNSAVDAVVGVSPRDCKMLRIVGGFKHVTLLRNGVDTKYFAPRKNVESTCKSAIFWGKLDFDPNVDAVVGFLRDIWPHVIKKHPDAVFRVVGKSPCQRVVDACLRSECVQLVGEVEDIRDWVCSSDVSILPMTSGAGIKNKLLEAASMARAIVGSKEAVNGLVWEEKKRPPWLVAKCAETWVDNLSFLWSDQKLRHDLGSYARKWVSRYHGLEAAAIWREEFVAGQMVDAEKVTSAA